METHKKKFIVDVLMFVTFLIISISGFILWLVLSRAKSSENQFIFSRATWVFLHNWTAVILIILVLIHLSLNWRWIAIMFKNTFTLPENIENGK